MINRIATIIIAQRGFVLAVAAVVTMLAALGAMRLRFDDQPRRLFESEGPAFEELYQLFDDFGMDDTEALIVLEAPDVLARYVIEFTKRITERAQAAPGVATVRSVIDIVIFDEVRGARPLVDVDSHDESDRNARHQILAHPLVRGLLISEDQSTALIRVTLEPAIDEVREIRPVIDGLRAILMEEKSTLAHPETLRASLTGIPPLRVEIIETIRHEQIRFLFVGAALGIVIAWLIFRHIVAVAIVTGVPLVGAIWTLGALGWAGEPVNVINAVLPTLVLVIGFTDSVHLMVDMRRSRAHGLDPIRTSMHAIRHLGPACALTSFTTMVGFGSLAAASVDVIQRFGLACAAGTVITFCAVVTLGPVLTSFAGTERIVSIDRFTRREALRAKAMLLIDAVLRAPRFFSFLGIAITIALAVIALQLHPDNRLAESIPSNREGPRALRHVDEAFGGILQVFVVVSWPDDEALTSPRTLEIIDRIHAALGENPITNHPVSIRNVLASLPQGASAESLLPLIPKDVLHRFVKPERRRLAVIARVRDVGAAAIEPRLDEIDAWLADLRSQYPDYSFTLTGTTAVAARNLQVMIGDLARSLGLAAVVIFIALAVAFRSLRVGLISLVPNLFPLVATAAFLVLIGRPLEITSVIVFSVCLGIAVDDTIHFLTRFRRERELHDCDVATALRRAFVAVGAALITTTVVLLAGFGSVVLSEVPAIRLFAGLSCLAITTALIGDLFILPAMLVAFGPDQRERKEPQIHTD